jgi:hypothetical protein
MRRAARMALEGDLAAMRLVLERTCGRAVEAPTEGLALDLTLPNLRTAANCTSAIDRLVDAICQGTVDRESAKILIEVINARLKAIEVTDLETRLAGLEKTASAIDPVGQHNIRRA